MTESPPDSEFFRARAEAGKPTTFPVDIKPLEALDPHFKARGNHSACFRHHSL